MYKKAEIGRAMLSESTPAAQTLSVFLLFTANGVRLADLSGCSHPRGGNNG